MLFHKNGAPWLIPVAAWLVSVSAPAVARAQNFIPSSSGFESPGCSATDLHRTDDFARANPEWKAILIDPAHPLPNNPPSILEGFVAQPHLPPLCSADINSPLHCEASGDQAPSEVSEEELPWNHYTHDYTFKVVPDAPYQFLLATWPNPRGDFCPDGSHDANCHQLDMEVEWENGSVMKVNDDDDRMWGAFPEFVWPSVNDRVWVEGRWVFDCGHVGDDPSGETALVQFTTEIHPPRAVVAFRLNHPALSDSATASTSPASWLTVTGQPVILAPDAPNTGPTRVPVTEADVFISGNGGGANDVCHMTPSPCPGHTGPIIPIDDRNYVFDIYPPGTNYDVTVNGTFQVTPPVADASLQWRTVDQTAQIPLHTCGGPDTNGCIPATPLFCQLDATTGPPDQSETSCPPVPDHPTRLRVILTFAGPFPDNRPHPNYFAQSILLGWDDVPAPPATTPVRTFAVRLHKLTVKENGEGNPLLGAPDGDWRVFLGVGGQWRYMSASFDRVQDGSNRCSGDALTENGDDDCFQYDDTPFIVSVADGTPIHVAVGGFESDHIDSDFCRTYPGGCDSDTGLFLALFAFNDDRIGTYEFDLTKENGDYAPPAPFMTAEPICHPDLVILRTCDELEYAVEFNVVEITPPTPPASGPLVIGAPSFVNGNNTFVSAATPLTLSSSSPDAEGFQYRSYIAGSALPTYTEIAELQMPVHWTHADFPVGSTSASVGLSGPDGAYLLQYSAENFANLLEPRHSASITLDDTPPVIDVVQPQSTTYPHNAVLTLNYSVGDGIGSGVQAFSPLMDNMATIGGHGLQPGQDIHLLTELKLGDHTFTVNASDNLNNADAASVTFTIIVTADSIKDDVRQFLASGAIKNEGLAGSLLAMLDAAASQRAAGNCAAAANIYQAFINALSAQSGKGVDATAAAVMIADAQYLIAHCP